MSKISWKPTGSIRRALQEAEKRLCSLLDFPPLLNNLTAEPSLHGQEWNADTALPSSLGPASPCPSPPRLRRMWEACCCPQPFLEQSSATCQCQGNLSGLSAGKEITWPNALLLWHAHGFPWCAQVLSLGNIRNEHHNTFVLNPHLKTGFKNESATLGIQL